MDRVRRSSAATSSARSSAYVSMSLPFHGWPERPWPLRSWAMQRYPRAARKIIWSSQASAAQGPTVTEDDRLALPPVFVIDLRYHLWL